MLFGGHKGMQCYFWLARHFQHHKNPPKPIMTFAIQRFRLLYWWFLVLGMLITTRDCVGLPLMRHYLHLPLDPPPEHWFPVRLSPTVCTTFSLTYSLHKWWETQSHTQSPPTWPGYEAKTSLPQTLPTQTYLDSRWMSRGVAKSHFSVHMQEKSS